ncbi:MAG: response regulator [Bacteroidales bacterium]|nr:response regulator [Bacteroidales bacterium]
MKNFKFSSIRTNLTFWFLILSLLPLIVAMFISFSVSSNAFEERSYNKLITIRDLRVEQVNTWLDERIGDLKIFAQNTDAKLLVDAITKPDTDLTNKTEEQAVRNILYNYQKAYQVYEEIYIINSQTGEVDISTNQSNEGLDKKGEPIYTEAIRLDRVYISPIHYSSETGKNILTLSAPLYDDWNMNSKVIGVLVANIDLSMSLYPLLLNTTGLGETGEALIVDKDVVALNELRNYQYATLQLKIKAEPALYASQGKTGIIKSVDYRGEPVLAAYTYFPRTGWGFVCKEDLSELDQPFKALQNQLALLFILSVFIIIGIVYFVSKSISSPILSMNRVAQKISTGDFSVRNTISSTDELGLLAHSFNKMAAITESKLKVQQGVVDISETMIGKTDLNEFGTSLLKLLMQVSDAHMSTFYILNEENTAFIPFASVGANKDMLKAFDSEHPEGEFGNALSNKSIVHLKNIPSNTIFNYKTVAGDVIPHEIITIPILVEDVVVAFISLVHIKKFSKESIEILKQSWININTSYSNIVTHKRTLILADHLSEINEQLEVQAEELQEQSEELQNQAYVLQHNSEELQAQNLELDKQRKHVEAANKLKSEFLSNMSHELRTPLNSIMALSRVLIMQAKDKLNEDENNYLEIVERNGKRLLALINDILDLSKIEAGKMEMIPNAVSLSSFLNILLENMSSLAEEKGLAMNLSIDGDLPHIESDEMRLHQVFTNIIGNAIKFTKKGSVDISAHANSESVIIQVKDSGIGISKENLPFIFDEFRQADGTTAREYEGTGLGLAIAKKIIDILGGKIEVESEPGIGTTFSIQLPIKWSKKPEAIVLESLTTEPVIAEKLILLVDEDINSVESLTEFLKDAGYKTVHSKSIKEAIDLAEQNQPFALIIDISLENRQGFRLLEALSKNTKTQDLPVIIFTSEELTEDEKFKLSTNVSAFIKKEKTNLAYTFEEFSWLFEEIEKTHSNNHKHKRKAKKRLLIVEDNQEAIVQIKSVLEKEHYTVDVATGGKEALEYINHTIPDGIILDLMMPEIDGFEVLEKLRGTEKSKKIPVLILTAKDLTREDLTRLSNNNIQQLIHKGDIDIKGLLLKVSLMLENGTTQNNFQPPIREKSTKSKNSGLSTNKGLKHILIVEDNPDNMTTIKAILKDKYSISEALDGEMGLLVADKLKPDLIILDISLPKLTGDEIIKRLKTNKDTGSIPVLAVTAQAMKGDKENFLQMGFDGYVPKPINDELLLNEISMLLNRK